MGIIEELTRTPHPQLYLDCFNGMVVGVRAKVHISKGAIVASFNGAVYQNVKGDDDLPEEIEGLQIRGYPISIDETTARDGDVYARSINHSCQPNCGLRLAWVGTDPWPVVEIIAWRPILPRSAITYDYGTAQYESGFTFYPSNIECTCGEKHCRKLGVGWEDMPRWIRRKYINAEFVLPHVLRMAGAREQGKRVRLKDLK